MIKQVLCGSAALALMSVAASAQDDPTDYDRALAAGYKSMFLCSAMANAEQAGSSRSVESIEKWELTGIQKPLDSLIADMPHEVVRNGKSEISHVTVSWSEDMPPRIAAHNKGFGCVGLPIGLDPSAVAPGATKASAKAEPTEPAVPVAPNLMGAKGDALIAESFSDKYGKGTRTTAVLVRASGETQFESYHSDFGPNVPQRTWSVAKSFAATLAGMAVQEGSYNVDEPIGINYWRNSGGPRNVITLDNLLRMASGRYSDTAGNRTDPIYWGGTTLNERLFGWPLIAKPGTKFRYANNDTLLAMKAMETFLSYYQPDELFADLGFKHTVAETDWQGNYILSSQVWSTARDFAHLGQLYLDNGKQGDKQVLPENWREYVSSPSGPQPEGRPMGYGAGFWLFNKSDGIPADTFAAMGNRGQYIVIVPSKDTVIVRRGEDPTGSRFDIIAFTRDVLAAQEE